MGWTIAGLFLLALPGVYIPFITNPNAAAEAQRTGGALGALRLELLESYSMCADDRFRILFRDDKVRNCPDECGIPSSAGILFFSHSHRRTRGTGLTWPAPAKRPSSQADHSETHQGPHSDWNVQGVLGQPVRLRYADVHSAKWRGRRHLAARLLHRLPRPRLQVSCGRDGHLLPESLVVSLT